MFDVIDNFKKLKDFQLSLDSAKIGFNGALALELRLSRSPIFRTLESFSISLIHNNLTDEGLVPILDGLKNVGNLKSFKLILLSNGLKESSGQPLGDFLQTISKNSKLEDLTLNFYANKLGPVGSTKMFTQL